MRKPQFSPQLVIKLADETLCTVELLSSSITPLCCNEQESLMPFFFLLLFTSAAKFDEYEEGKKNPSQLYKLVMKEKWPHTAHTSELYRLLAEKLRLQRFKKL